MSVQGVTALHLASALGHGPLASLLLDANATIDAANNDGAFFSPFCVLLLRWICLPRSPFCIAVDVTTPALVSR